MLWKQSDNLWLTLTASRKDNPMNEPGLPQAITAGSLVLAVFVVGNMFYRLRWRGRKNRKRKFLP